MNIIINGRRHEVLDADTMHWDRFCRLAGKKPEHQPTVVCSFPDGRGRALAFGEAVPLVEGAIYGVHVTSGA